MIEIVIDKPNKLKKTVINNYSGFIYCDYDMKLIGRIKQLSTRIYIPEKRCWEIPQSLIPIVCNKTFKDETIKLTGIYENAPIKQSLIPPEYVFKTKPYTHQMEGINYGLEHDTWLLGDDQGLGKTLQIINIATINKQYKNAKHCLIICGINGLKYNWEQEIALHSNEKSWILGTRFNKKGKKFIGTSQDKLDDLNNLPDYYFIITNIETLRQLSYKQKNKTVFPIVDKINSLCKQGQIDMIVIDESHKCFDYNTLIETNLGKLKIGDIVKNKINCDVLSSDLQGSLSFKPIIKWFKNPVNQKLLKLTIQLNSGKTTEINCTYDHKILTNNRGWVKAVDLTIDDDISELDCLQSYTNVL